MNPNVLILVYANHGLSLLSPLVTLPFLLRCLGAEGYGAASLAMAFGAYLQIIVDYGFSLSATREVSMHRHDLQRVRKVHSATLLAKCLLSLPTLTILVGISLAVPGYAKIADLILLGLLSSLLQTFVPVWIYQGMEAMHRMSVIGLAVKIAWIAVIFAVVRSPSDLRVLFELSILVYGMGSVAMLLDVGLVLGVVPRKVPFREVVAVLVKGRHLFFSQVGTLFFAQSNILLLGAFATTSQVGYYSVAEKIVRAAIGLIPPFAGIMYPRVARMMQDSMRVALCYCAKVLNYGVVLMVSMSLGLLWGADWIVRLAYGRESVEIADLVRLMSFVPLVSFLDNIFGTQILLASGRDKAFSEILIRAGVVMVFVQLLLVWSQGAVGAALSFFVSQVLATSWFLWRIHRLGMNPWRWRRIPS